VLFSQFFNGFSFILDSVVRGFDFRSLFRLFTGFAADLDSAWELLAEPVRVPSPPQISGHSFFMRESQYCFWVFEFLFVKHFSFILSIAVHIHERIRFRFRLS
jgi:hypothetical protein